MDNADTVSSVIREAKTSPNMVLVESQTKPEYILAAIESLSAERVCFESDHPFRLMHVCRAMIETAVDELPETV